MKNWALDKLLIWCERLGERLLKWRYPMVRITVTDDGIDKAFVQSYSDDVKRVVRRGQKIRRV